MDVNRYSILAKPSGITLEIHRQDVMSECALLTQNIPFTLQKYKIQTGKDLVKRMEVACKYHDDGKEISRKWQISCQKDYDDFLCWQLNNNGKSFKEYSKGKDAGSHIRIAGIRHEFYSLKKNRTLPLVLQVAIAAHHRKLGENFEDRWINEGFKEYWDKFKRENSFVIEQNSLALSSKKIYEFSGVRGLLQLADHRASAKEDGDVIPDCKCFHYQFPYKEKRGVQKLVEEHWLEDLLLIRAPTGAGKTDASLLWASKQINNKRAERLVIAMPTRFTSNALAVSVAESLSDTGLYHSSAWFTRFQEKVEAGIIKKQKAEKIHEFARLLQTPITVCTIDHLLMALTLTREDHQLILFNLANSCLVIDEADFYDDFTQANILVLLEILKYWKVPVLVMSASLPESVLPSYRQIGYRIDHIIEDTSDNSRYRFEIKTIKDYSELSEIENLLQLCIKNGSAIIYVNTIDKAALFYHWFKDRNVDPILYHSRFTEPDKKNKEQELINALGKDAWEKKSAKGIAILTQIGEMSINISADLMISELCPIDRLTQRAGRLCRFDKLKVGELYILIPQKNDSIYPAPYGEYNRTSKNWIPCKAFTKTKDVLETKVYSAQMLVDLINQVYCKDTSFSSRAVSNAKLLKDYFRYNWLINPMQIIRKDDFDTNFWRSRDIAPQDTVFVCKPEFKRFYNYLDFQSWKIKNSVELPVYIIEKGRKQHKVDMDEIYIKDDKEVIYFIRNGFYDKSMGVNFTEEEQFM